MNIIQNQKSFLVGQNDNEFSILAFYCLLGEKAREFRVQLEEETLMFKTFCNKHLIKGTILVSKEGINGTVAGSAQAVESFLSFLKKYFISEEDEGAIKDSENPIFEYKFSYANFIPFTKMKVLNKMEVVSLKSEMEMDLTLKPENADEHIWDELLNSEEVQLIDTRNDYEYEIGTFKGAINPKTKNFRDFKNYLNHAIENNQLNKEKTCAIFCTGGIRCEKAGIYMRNLGFKKVVQLQGGILKYLEKTKNINKNWQGDCFVFDDRVTVDDQLRPGKLRCINCLKEIETIEEKRSATKAKVFCRQCKK